MGGKSRLLFTLLVAGLLIVSYMPSNARAQPVITEMMHIPKYPHINDPVSITARVEGAVAITDVVLFFCGKGGICQHFDMFDPNLDHVYNQTITPDYSGLPEGEYYIVATDANSDQTMSDYVYVQYAKSINATMTSDKQEVLLGGVFNLTVSAHYWSNFSAPVENSSVNITRDGSSEYWTGMTDENGRVTIQITAPPVVSSPTYRATITNTSLASSHVLTGTNDTSVLVFEELIPDLLVRPQDIQYAPVSPFEGDNVTANITIKNVGNEDEDFYVLIIVRAGGVNYTLKNVSLSLHAWNETGNSSVIKVWWNAHLGLQELNITIDPGDMHEEASEDNNFASVYITGNPVQPPPDGNDDGTVNILGLKLSMVAATGLLIAVVAFLVLVAFMVATRRRRRKLESADSMIEEEEHPPQEGKE